MPRFRRRKRDGVPVRRFRRAKSVVPSTIASVNTIVAVRLAELLERDPEFRDQALEMGVIDHRWLEDPGRHPMSRVPPVAVMRRFLERSVERRPSALTRLGLSALQVLAADGELIRDAAGQARVTVVFTDLEGFTRYTSTHGDSAARELLDEHHRAVGPIVRRWGGRVVKRLGDGLMLTFPDPGYAVRAALELVDQRPEGLKVRAGLHAGEAVVTRDDLVGHVVNIAARITDLAAGGQVLASEAVITEAGELDGLRLSKPLRKRVKGVSQPVSVRAVRPGTA
ncbi:adenylate/guanylate cyclase domain-containing protein [Haloechinothrix sp. LS1_15]|uniref:adenylate/guanylate cyclase domain-containing protein n=1 Tax=Haloechinothrix sp. LS1_15 TaxID=2652248 RepID=UPI00294AAE8C|nr:adenylate/guanylate cyclase domain-containing protein [Haloechinothrix sp. LS1_15]